MGGASVAVPPGRARRARRAARRAGRADQRVDVPLGRAGRAAALGPRADPDERLLGRAVPRELEAHRSTRPGWVESGSLRLASSPARLEEIRRQAGWAQRSGLPLELVSADEAARAVPADVHRGRARRGLHAHRRARRPGAAVPGAGRAGPGRRGDDRAAHPGARHRDPVRPRTGCAGCAPTAATSSARWWSTAAACSPPRSPGWSDVRIPVVPMSHQYVVTAPLPAGAGSRPDRTAAVAARPGPARLLPPGDRRPGDGRLRAAERPVHRHRRPATTPCRPTSTAGCWPPDWDRFERDRDERPGAGAGAGRHRRRLHDQRPEAFTPDNEFCLGETEVAGFFVAAGFCAHGIAGAGGIGQVMAAWILDGDPGMDLWHMDVRRFGRHYRSPGYTLARTVENYESYYDIRYPAAERAAGPAAADLARLPVARRARRGVRGEGRAGSGSTTTRCRAPRRCARAAGPAGHWSPCVEPEHVAVRERAGLFDESSFSKIEITGPDAAAFCAHVFAGRVRPGTRRGGLHPGPQRPRRHRDGRDRHPARRRRVPGGHRHRVRAARPRLAAPAGPAHRARRCGIADVTAAGPASGCGARAPATCWPRSPRTSLANADFPYLAMRETTVGDVPVRALRVDVRRGAGLGAVLLHRVRRRAVADARRHRRPALRLPGDREPAAGEGLPGVGRRHRPRHHPGRGRAGLRRAAAAAGSSGREALLAARAGRGRRRPLRCLVLDDPRAVALGGEPVRLRRRGPSSGR